MSDDVDECVRGVLEDNPDYDESRAWAICRAQQATDKSAEGLVATPLSEFETMSADALDQIAETTGWERFESEQAVAWVDTAPGPDQGATVYQALDEPTSQQADGFAVDVFQVVDAEGRDDLDSDLLGFCVDFPNADVYVDWNVDAWPDDEQLASAHVSIYGSIDDLEQATGNTAELLETVGPVDAGGASQEAEFDFHDLELVESLIDDFREAGEPLDASVEAFLEWLEENTDVDRETIDDVFDPFLEDVDRDSLAEATVNELLEWSRAQGGGERQAVIAGLSQEAIADIERRYNVDVEKQSAEVDT